MTSSSDPAAVPGAAPSSTSPAGGRAVTAVVAEPTDAARWFAAKLAVETDPADVAADQAAGRGGFVMVDARSAQAYADGHVPGALSLPHATIDEATTAGLSRADVHVVYCWSPGCNAGDKGAAKLAALGFRVKLMIGGWEQWQSEIGTVEHGTDVAGPT
jgi:rhodanese-related sulfurtransferase